MEDYKKKVYRYETKAKALPAAAHYGHNLREVLPELRSDKDIVLAAVKSKGYALGYASEDLRGDKEVCAAAVKQNWWALHCCSDAMRKDETVALKAVKQSWRALVPSENAPNALASEVAGFRSVVLAAVKQRGLALQHASKEMRKDKKVVATALKQNDAALQFAAPELQANSAFLIKALVKAAPGWRGLQFAAECVRHNPDVILAAFKRWGHSPDAGGILNLFSPEHSSSSSSSNSNCEGSSNGYDNRRVDEGGYGGGGGGGERANIVSSSYGDKSSSSNSSSSGCSSNNNTAATAAASASNWRHLQNDPDFVFACLELCPFALAHAGPVPRANEACVLAAVQQDGELFYSACGEAAESEKCARAAVMQNGWALGACTKAQLAEFCVDQELMTSACAQYPHALKYASVELQNNKDLVLFAVQSFGFALVHASEILRDNEEVVLAAVRAHGEALEYASLRLRSLPHVVLEACQRNSAAASFANQSALIHHPDTAHLFDQWYMCREGFGAMPRGAKSTLKHC